MKNNKTNEINNLINELNSTLPFNAHDFKEIGRDKKLLAKLFDILQVRKEERLNFSIPTITSNDTEFFITVDEGYIKCERGY